MKNDKCSKNFPKTFQNETIIDETIMARAYNILSMEMLKIAEENIKKNPNHVMIVQKEKKKKEKKKKKKKKKKKRKCWMPLKGEGEEKVSDEPSTRNV
jgi:hypothetical protein